MRNEYLFYASKGIISRKYKLTYGSEFQHAEELQKNKNTKNKRIHFDGRHFEIQLCSESMGKTVTPVQTSSRCTKVCRLGHDRRRVWERYF